MYDLFQVTQVAKATKDLKHLTIRQAVDSVCKAYGVSPEDKVLVEQALIEYELGISDPVKGNLNSLSPTNAINLLEGASFASRNKDKSYNLMGDEDCDPEIAEKALRDYIVRLILK